MKFQIGKGSDWKFEEVREINTLEGLLALIKEFDCDIVVGNKFGMKPDEGHDYRITIYDDYLE